MSTVFEFASRAVRDGATPTIAREQRGLSPDRMRLVEPAVREAMRAMDELTEGTGWLVTCRTCGVAWDSRHVSFLPTHHRRDCTLRGLMLDLDAATRPFLPDATEVAGFVERARKAVDEFVGEHGPTKTPARMRFVGIADGARVH